MLNEYYMRSEPYSSMECITPSLENDPIVRNHIIVCGIHSSIAHFIMPLRAKFLHPYQLKHIVIITGEPDERGGDQIDT
jgi:hypothetical protein